MEIQIVPEKSQWSLPAEFQLPHNCSTALERQRFHLNLDLARYDVAHRLRQRPAPTLCINDFINTLAYCYAVALTTGDNSLYVWSAGQYVARLREERIATGDCYIYLYADELTRALWRRQDSVRQPRADRFFDPTFSGTMEQFFSYILSEKGGKGTLPGIWCNSMVDLVNINSLIDRALRCASYAVKLDLEAFSEQLLQILDLQRIPPYAKDENDD